MTIDRFLALIGAILIIAWTTRSLRRGKVCWRFPFYDEIRRKDMPVIFFGSIILGYALGIVGLLGFLGLVEINVGG
jgi:hypothetical protein